MATGPMSHVASVAMSRYQLANVSPVTVSLDGSNETLFNVLNSALVLFTMLLSGKATQGENNEKPDHAKSEIDWFKFDSNSDCDNTIY